jgi:hypothetical protein
MREALLLCPIAAEKTFSYSVSHPLSFPRRRESEGKCTTLASQILLDQTAASFRTYSIKPEQLQ